MSLPTHEEICPHDDLDGREASKHFLGKNLAEAEALFLESPLFYQADLMWMGPIAFRYYLPAAISFIRSEAAICGSDFISSFASTLESRLEFEPQELQPVAYQLAAICTYIIQIGRGSSPGQSYTAMSELATASSNRHFQSCRLS